MRHGARVASIWAALLGVSACGGGDGAPTISVEAGKDLVLPVSQNLAQLDGELEGYLQGQSSGQAARVEWRVIGAGGAPVSQSEVMLRDAAQLTTAVGAGVAGVYTAILTVEGVDGAVGSDELTIIVIEDQDRDGIVDGEDSDIDGDGYPNAVDVRPREVASHADTDGDGRTNFEQSDEDGDGVIDSLDPEPFDPSISSYALREESIEPDADNRNDGTRFAELPVAWPFELRGQMFSASGRADVDYFEVTGLPATRVTIRAWPEGGVFAPQVSASDLSGRPIASFSVHPGDDSDRAAISFVPPAGERIFIAVSRADNRNVQGSRYVVRAFVDADLDGVSDEIERALDANERSIDGDGDGVGDYHEVDLAVSAPQLVDVDGDGVPAWWDRDADGDGPLDGIEAGLLDFRVRDSDNDGVPDVFDRDADGDGRDDRDGGYGRADQPSDTNADGTPDFASVDDDGDGVPDAADPLPLERNPLVATLLRIANPASLTAPTCASGQSLRLWGSKLNDPGFKVYFVRSGRVVSASPKSVGETVVDVDCPSLEPGSYRVFLMRPDGGMTQQGEIHVPDPRTPLLNGAVSTGNGRVEFVGERLDQEVTVYWPNGTTSAVSGSQPDRLSVTLPTGMRAGGVHLSTAAGDSNQVLLEPQRTRSVTVRLDHIEGLDRTQLRVLTRSSQLATVSSSGFASVRVLEGGATVADVFDVSLGEDNPQYLASAILLNGESTVINARSTALALVWKAVVPFAGVPIELQGDLYDLLEKLESLPAFADELEAAQALNPALLMSQDQNTPWGAAWTQASLEAFSAIRTYIAPPAKVSAHPDPTVAPASAYNVSVQGTGDGAGDLNIVNGGTFYADYRATLARTGVTLADTRGNLIPGVLPESGPLGISLVSGVSSFEDSVTRIDGVVARDTKVTLFTGSANGPVDDQDALSRLNQWNTAEFLVAPLIDGLFGIGLDTGSVVPVAQLVERQLSPTLRAYASGSISTFDAAREIVKEMGDLVTTFPPPPELAELYASVAQGEAVDYLVWISRTVTPVLGQIRTIASVTDSLVRLGAYLGDTNGLVAQFDFDANFPLDLREVEARAVRPESVPVTFRLEGSGLFRPEPGQGEMAVTFRSSAGQQFAGELIGGSGVEDVLIVRAPAAAFVPGEAEFLDVIVAGSYAGRSESDTLARAILLSEGLLATSVEPPVVPIEGSSSVLGAGFSEIPVDNLVTVGGEAVTITSATAGRLRFVLPPRIGAGEYVVQVRSRDATGQWRGPVTAGNPLTVSATNVSMTLCDNGSAKDDSFALYVDQQAARVIDAATGPFCETFAYSLGGGNIPVQLVGLQAPDGVGTYSVAAQGGVFTAGQVTGTDLTPGVRKDLTFVVSQQAAAADPASSDRFPFTAKAVERAERGAAR